MRSRHVCMKNALAHKTSKRKRKSILQKHNKSNGKVKEIQRVSILELDPPKQASRTSNTYFKNLDSNTSKTTFLNRDACAKKGTQSLAKCLDDTTIFLQFQYMCIYIYYCCFFLVMGGGKISYTLVVSPFFNRFHWWSWSHGLCCTFKGAQPPIR